MSDKSPSDGIEIPFSAIKEEASRVDAMLEEQGEKEEREIDSGTYDAIGDSQNKNTLTMHRLFRWGLMALFGFLLLTMLIVLVSLATILGFYIYSVIHDPIKLEQIIKNIWKVLSGASIVVFFQLLAWSIKNKVDEHRKGGHKY